MSTNEFSTPPAGDDSGVDPVLLAFAAGRRNAVVATLKRDGRPQLSVVSYALDPEHAIARVSITDSRAKTRNLRRDPRVTFMVPGDNLGGYAVFDGTASLTAVATDPHDATVDALVDLYRTIQGEHPDWDDYRDAMVRDGRLVLSISITHAYGWVP